MPGGDHKDIEKTITGLWLRRNRLFQREVLAETSEEADKSKRI
jgi:hypothetical protein